MDNYPQEEGRALQHEHYHQYPTRRSTSVIRPQSSHPGQLGHNAEASAAPLLNHIRTSSNPKNVAFELRLEGAPNYRARLPMRVQIFPHDTTESIVTTVKNFYGLYEGAASGVSFEDDQGNTLIARYENFRNNMIVYVRVISDYSQNLEEHRQVANGPTSPQKRPHLEDAPRMLPPSPAQALHYGQSPSRPASRVSRKQSSSPRLGRAQQNTLGQKSRSRSGVKSHSSSFQANLDDLNNDAANGYSSSDGGAASVTSSRKARSEQLASAEISVDNIVEGGRRKRAKFESSVCVRRPMIVAGARMENILTRFHYYRNCHFLFHHRCQLQTQYLPSRRNDGPMALRMHFLSGGPHSVRSLTACLCNRLKAMHSATMRRWLCNRAVHPLQCRLRLATDIDFVIGSMVQLSPTVLYLAQSLDRWALEYYPPLIQL